MPPATPRSATSRTSTSRRKRKTFSCDDCRDAKRKCDRRHPCSNCFRTAKSCIYSAQECRAGVGRDRSPYPVHSVSHSEPSFNFDMHNPMTSTAPPSYHLNNGSISVDMEPVNKHTNLTRSVKSLLSQSLFVKALLTVWFRELDYMYDIVCGTQAEALRYKDRMDEEDCRKYMPLLAVIFALTAQLHGPDLDAVVSACFDPLLSSRELVEPALALAKDTIDDFLDASDSEDDEQTILPEYLQASLLVCAFFKNAGQMDQYRRRLYRDISCLIQASYHVLDSFSPQVHHQHTNFASNNPVEDLQSTPKSIRVLRPDQRGLVRRIFWAYFTCDRLYLMIGGPTSSYAIVSKHCNIWCYGKEGDGKIQHIQELCNGQDGRTLRNPNNGNVNGTHSAGPIKLGRGQSSRTVILNRLRSSESTSAGGLSRFSRGMVRAGALAGRCLDQISLVRTAQPLHPGTVEATDIMREFEENLAGFRVECFNVASLVEEQLTFLEKEYTLNRRGGNSKEGKSTSSPSSIPLSPNMEETRRQNHMLMLTICRLRRDVALSLGHLLHSTFPSIQPWLSFKEMITARALLDMVFKVPVEVPPRAMGWIFYLHYIAEPTIGMIKSISNDSGTDKTGMPTMLTPEEAKENLQFALKGRNLLCLIAAQSRVPLAQTLATKICHQLYSDVFPSLCDSSIRDTHIQIDAGQVTQQFYQSRMRLALQQKEGQIQEPLQQQGQGLQMGNKETLSAGTTLASLSTSPSQDLSPQFEALLAQDGFGEQQLSSLFASYNSSLVDSFNSSAQDGIPTINFNTNDLADAWEALFALPYLPT